MKFGKLKDISNINFGLPDDPEGTELILDHLNPNKEAPLIYIGATGWGMKEWVGKWYPNSTKSRDYLTAYGRQFNTIELNTTHYRIPRQELIEKWKRETPDDFVFCPKIPQSISHRNDLGLTGDKIEIFSREIKGLGKKLGCCFMQMPPYFKPDKIAIFERFISEWDYEIPLAIELRNEIWFSDKNHQKYFFKLLEKYNISTVITDVAGRRDVLHMRLTTDIAMIRFVGNGLVHSDYERIDQWIDRIKIWVDRHIKKVYFFGHEPDNILSPELAKYIAEKIKEKIPLAIVRGPQPILNQMSLF